MKQVIAILVVALLMFTTAIATAEESKKPKSLEIGVVPYLSARVLVKSYEPMRQYLEQVLGIPVKIYTANGFKQFLLNAQHGDYDAVVIPAHFARILQLDQHFSPMARYSKGGRGLIMVAKNGPIKELNDLKGKTVAVPFRLSLASIICMNAMEDHGLTDGQDIKILEVPSFESAITAVQKGEASAAVSAPGALVQMSKTLQASVKPVLDTGEYVNLIYLSHPRLKSSFSTTLENTFFKFGKTDEGKRFFASTGFGEFLHVTDQNMKSLDKYIPNTRQLLEEKQ
jgi:phosphonate transport system substrate-binding protein